MVFDYFVRMNGSLRLLPKQEQKFGIESRPDGTLLLVAGCYVNRENVVKWMAIPFSTFSETLTCWKDLERLVVDLIDTVPV